MQITDRNGHTITTCVMSRKQSGQKVTLESTGSTSRDSSTAVNSQAHKNLEGKVLRLETTVDGMKVENSQRDEKYSQLILNVDGIFTEVASMGGEIAQIRQESNSISMRVEALNGDLNTMYEGVVAALELYVQKDDNDQIVSMLNASANAITIKSNRLSIQSDNCTLTKDGHLTVKDADVTGKITATSGSFTGTIHAGAGEIGGWGIDGNSIHHKKDGSIGAGTFMCSSGT